MKKTWVTELLILAILFASPTCRGDHEKPRSRECAAIAIANAVGAAVTKGDAGLLNPTLIDTRDLAWFQDAPAAKPNVAFESKVHEEVAENVAAWASICRGGEVQSVVLGHTRRNHAVEGFAKRFDVIEDSIVHVSVRGKDVPVRIQYLFSNNGCWRLVEVGKPRG